jgi:agmatinase
MAPISETLLSKGLYFRNKVRNYLENFTKADGEDTALLEEVNAACEEMVDWVYRQSKHYLNQGKKLILLGGDHSTPLGYLKALADEHPTFGVLQIDAHMDFRHAYEGFEYSHASISFNFMKIPQIQNVVQIGIRDYCDEELEFAKSLGGRAKIFFDFELRKSQYSGKSWDSICDEILAHLPEKIYISFDIDGLDPKLCPNTGTPVPGGLSYSEIEYLFEKIVHSGKKIIGADLNEVGIHPTHDWDANVGARILFMLCNIF